MRRRIAGLTLLSLLLSPSLIQANGAPPIRDYQGHWAQSIIENGITRGWVSGFPDGTVRPDALITRAEFYKLLTVAMQAQPEPGWAPFVELEHWSIKGGWIPAAVGAGLIEPTDYADYRFDPERPITRQELILAAVRAIGLEGSALIGEAPLHSTLTIADPEPLPEWLLPWARIAMAEGLIHGFQDQTLRVQSGASRAEALAVISRIVDRLTLELEPVAMAPVGKQYGPGEPIWSEAGWDGFRPLIQSVYTPPAGQIVNPVTGHQTYTLPEYARGIQILPAPGAKAWARYTVDGADNITIDVFALLVEGQIQEAARYRFEDGEFQSGLAVEATGALLLQDGGYIRRLYPDGRTEVLAIDLPLTHPVLDQAGTLWGATADGAQLVRVTSTGEVDRIDLPVTPFGQTISAIFPGAKGDLWLLRWDQVERETHAILVRDGALTQTLLLLPARVHGADAMPVSVIGLADGSAFIARQQQTGPTSWTATGYYRFNLATGAVEPLLAPAGATGPLQVRGVSDGDAILVDTTGQHWRVPR